MKKYDYDAHNQYNQILESDLSDVEKIAQAFELVTGQIIDHGQKDLEIFKALGDKDSLVKEQIKQETLRFTRSVFQEAFSRVTGRSAWDE